MDNGPIQPDKEITPVGRKALSERNIVFLEKLADGLPVQDAYKLAGYEGSPHTAYELRRQLRAELKQVLEARGYTIEGVATEVLNLNKLKLAEGYAKYGITLKEKIALLRLQLLALGIEKEKPQAQQNVTAFIINRGPQGTHIVTQPSVDTTGTPEGTNEP